MLRYEPGVCFLGNTVTRLNQVQSLLGFQITRGFFSIIIKYLQAQGTKHSRCHCYFLLVSIFLK